MSERLDQFVEKSREMITQFESETEQRRGQQFLDFVVWVEENYPGLIPAPEQQAAVMAGLLRTASDEAVEEAFKIAREEYIPRVANDPSLQVKRLLRSIFGD